MNDLTVRQEAMLEEVSKHVYSQAAWAAHPLGHTPYQIKNFILNKREYPTDAAKFRQVVRELYARKQAYWQVKDQLEQIPIDEILARADLLEWTAKRPWLGFWFPWTRKRREAGIRQAELKLAQCARKKRDLLDDLEHRIMRETLEFLEEAKACCPPDPAKEYSMDNEDALWRSRAKSNPQLNDMVPQRQNGGT